MIYKKDILQRPVLSAVFFLRCNDQEDQGCCTYKVNEVGLADPYLYIDLLIFYNKKSSRPGNVPGRTSTLAQTGKLQITRYNGRSNHIQRTARLPIAGHFGTIEIPDFLNGLLHWGRSRQPSIICYMYNILLQKIEVVYNTTSIIILMYISIKSY